MPTTHLNVLDPWRDSLEPWAQAHAELAALWREYQLRLASAWPAEQLLERVALLEAVQAVARWVGQNRSDQAPALLSLLQEREADLFYNSGIGLATAAVLDTLGDLAGAAQRLAAVLDPLCRDGDPAAALVVRVALGRVMVMQGDEVGATPVLLQGIAQASVLGAKQQEAKMLGNLGFLYGESGGQPFEAFTRRALELGREIGDLRLVAHSLCNLGAALSAQGQLAQARQCHDEGLPLAQRLGWMHSVALFHAGIGGVLAQSGEVEAGLALYQRSSAWFEGAGDGYQVARLALSVAQHLWRAGRAEEAQGQLRHCLALCSRSPLRNLEWQAHALLGEVLDHLGDPRGALEALRASLRLRQTMIDTRSAERMHLLELHVEAERARANARQQQRKADELAGLAFRDPLTNLYNRRYMLEAIANEQARSRRRGYPHMLALLDADHFKSVNDRFGHQVGDEVLVEIGQRLRSSLRTEDVVARWGGEEFCVLLSETDEPAGRRVIERLLERVRERPIATGSGEIAVTVSVGATMRRDGDQTCNDLLVRADLALYQAKREGRNRMCIQG